MSSPRSRKHTSPWRHVHRRVTPLSEESQIHAGPWRMFIEEYPGFEQILLARSWYHQTLGRRIHSMKRGTCSILVIDSADGQAGLQFKCGRRNEVHRPVAGGASASFLPRSGQQIVKDRPNIARERATSISISIGLADEWLTLQSVNSTRRKARRTDEFAIHLKHCC